MDETPLSPAELEKLWALDAEATPAPWAADVTDTGILQVTAPADTLLDFVAWIGDMESTAKIDHDNAALIAALRNAAPRLFAMLAARDRTIAELMARLETQAATIAELMTRLAAAELRAGQAEFAADLYHNAIVGAEVGFATARKDARWPAPQEEPTDA